jgi:adenine-specific DNA methylase
LWLLHEQWQLRWSRIHNFKWFCHPDFVMRRVRPAKPGGRAFFVLPRLKVGSNVTAVLRVWMRSKNIVLVRIETWRRD